MPSPSASLESRVVKYFRETPLEIALVIFDLVKEVVKERKAKSDAGRAAAAGAKAAADRKAAAAVRASAVLPPKPKGKKKAKAKAKKAPAAPVVAPGSTEGF